VNELYLLLHEDIVKEEVSKRSKKEIFNVQLKRVASFILIFFALSIGWTLITLGSVYENYIQNFFKNLTNNNFIGEWSSTLIMNILNYIIPWVLHKVDKLSSWDFAS
jgi:membrane-bound acyltransferase YfiQ involved in biofilm formation